MLALCALAHSLAGAELPATMFQSSQPWSAEIAAPSDGVMVYGAGGKPGRTLAERAESWRSRGYRVLFMTGIAWGGYGDWFAAHPDTAQKDRKGNEVLHSPGTPYVVPTEEFAAYMFGKHVKHAIDAGFDAIVLEEPEFWTRAGYSEAFKREWRAHYGCDWRDPALSAEDALKANALKARMYRRAIEKVFAEAKRYGRGKGMDVKCIVASHSPVNYSAGGIAGPGASLAGLDCIDGFVAQVWTGTSRVPGRYRGVKKSRTFETALCEYGTCFASFASPGKALWFLADPIEDAVRHWNDYRRNYRAVFAAQFMTPGATGYETMPWPSRIYTRKYPATGPKDGVKCRIPPDYAMEMHAMICALCDMPAELEIDGPQGVAVAVSDSMMYRRVEIGGEYGADTLDSFYGAVYPFVKRGVGVKFVHLDRVAALPAALDGVKLLVLPQDGGWTPSRECEEALSKWAESGGGTLLRRNTAPVAADAAGEEAFWRDASDAYFRAAGAMLEEKNSFVARRGAYLAASVLDESVSDAPLALEGRYIDLLDCHLPVVGEKRVAPGEQAFLYDIARCGKKAPAVLCGSARVTRERVEDRVLRFTASCPAGTRGALRILFDRIPGPIDAGDGASASWDEGSKTLLLEFPNSPSGVDVSISLDGGIIPSCRQPLPPSSNKMR